MVDVLSKMIFRAEERGLTEGFLVERYKTKGVLYGCKPMQKNNPYYKSTFKNFTKVVRLRTDGKAGIPIAGFSDC